ncbi:hypothetical protein [Konateibacter massiliensis]|nr:hypothetical protein [Konateibacter massiliensis]
MEKTKRIMLKMAIVLFIAVAVFTPIQHQKKQEIYDWMYYAIQ